MAFYEFPGSNFHDLNLDWLLQEMKNCLAEWASTKADWQALTASNEAFKAAIEAEWTEVKNYITNYFETLDISQEIADRINSLIEDGTIRQIIVESGEIESATSDWLASHIAQETGYVIDNSLTVPNAAADASVTGENVFALKATVSKPANTAIVNLWDSLSSENVIGAYVDGQLRTYANYELFTTNFIPVTPGHVYYLSWQLNQTGVDFFDSAKGYISQTTFQAGNKITVPDNASIAYMTIPINRNVSAIAVVSATPIIPGYNPFTSGTNKETSVRLVSVSSATLANAYATYPAGANPYCVDQVRFTSHTSGWQAWLSGCSEAIVCGKGNLVVGYSDTYFLAAAPATGIMYRMTKGENTSNNIGTFQAISNTFEKEPYYVKINGKKLIVVGMKTGEKTEIDMTPYVDGNYTAEIGISLHQSQRTGQGISILYIGGNSYYYTDSIWRGKLLYAYGTSITSTAQGKYVPTLAALAGMSYVNKGIPGGGIGDLGAYAHGQVYDAVCNDTDGKLEADLITLETGANDVNESVPLGTIYDTGRSTLAGCLNDCIRYLQSHTQAQIVVIASPATTAEPDAASQYYAWRLMIEQICKINNVAFILPATNMGYAKLASESGSNYVVDSIHQTALGGKVFAHSIWSVLKNIPEFMT